ncbi:MAG: SusC/RagA family TonB-linked outer membrane protein [Tenacibaculum sp.]
MKKNYYTIFSLFCILLAQFVFAQQRTITGTVSDESGPLPGVTILKKGTTQGTETDFDGNYAIQAKAGDLLLFSYVGMRVIEKTVGASNVINVFMSSDNTLEEVVVTALGIERKPKELSYSVSKLRNEDVTKTKAVNVATAMIGKVSGLQINTINNGINPSTRATLRGNRSLLGNNQALIVVDGFPSERGVLDRINSNDIESMSILKGANASSLYGSDAANGVILITTKKGKGKLSVNYSSTFQMENVAYLPELQTEFGVGGFPDGTLLPLENVNWGPRYDGRMVAISETLDNGEVWEVPFWPIKDRNKNFFDTGTLIRNGVELSGGNNDESFLLSVDHSSATGIVPKDVYERTNARFKANKKYGKLDVGGNLAFFRSRANLVSIRAGRQGRPVYWNILNTPLHVPLSEMKNWKTGKFTRNEVSFFRFYENPYFIIDTQREFTEFTEFNFLAHLNYQIADWISTTLRVGYTGNYQNFKREFEAFNYAFNLKNTYSEIDPYGAKTLDQVQNQTRVNSDFILNINKDISKKFKVKLILGHNVRLTASKLINVSGNNLIIPDFYNVSTRTGELAGSEITLNYRKIGLYADFTFGFNDYLFLNITGRNDWSSTLPKDNRSFFYPGVGMSFIATDAISSIKSDKGLSYLKVNFNITKTGNDPGLYVTQATFLSQDGPLGKFPYGSLAGLSQSNTVPSPNLKPEFTTSIEAGLELSLFKDRLSTNITAYKTNTTDQIVPINVSIASGASSAVINVGEIQNIGLEIDLFGTLIKKDNFTWETGLTYSAYNSKVLSLTKGVEELGIASNTPIIAKVGQPYPLLQTSAYARDPQGRVIVGDDGDPIEDSKLKVQGKTTPDYILGLNTNLSYKGFNFYAVMDYRTGHVFFNDLVNALEFTGLIQQSVQSGRKAFVFPNSSYSDGKGGYIANTNRLTSGGGNDFWSNAYGRIKENYVTDATILKIRELLLSYEFDSEYLRKFGFEDLSVGIFGRNVLTFRPKENVYTDPEFNFSSGNAVGYGTQAQTPPTRQFGINLTLKF